MIILLKNNFEYKTPLYIDFSIYQINFILNMITEAKDHAVKNETWFSNLLNEINILAKSNILMKQLIYFDRQFKSFSRIFVINEKKMLLILKALQHNYRSNNAVFNDIINFEMTESLISWKIQLLNEQNNLWPTTAKQFLAPVQKQMQTMRF